MYFYIYFLHIEQKICYLHLSFFYVFPAAVIVALKKCVNKIFFKLLSIKLTSNKHQKEEFIVYLRVLECITCMLSVLCADPADRLG